MSFGFGGFPGMQPDIHYLFIDGACLRQILKDISQNYFEDSPLHFNYGYFATHFDKIFYFDALPPKKKAESEEDYNHRVEEIEALFDTIRMTNGFHVYLGSSRARKKVVQQKKVDMLLAAHMFKHTFYKNMTKATLLAGDSDFVPLVDTLVDIGMHVNLWYGNTENCRVSKELIGSADSSKRITVHSIYGSSSAAIKNRYMFPENIIGKKEILSQLIAKWNDTTLGEIELFKTDTHYWLIYDSQEGTNRYLHYKHNDLKFFRTYAKDELNIEIPSI